MSNLATACFRVEKHPGFWLIFRGGVMVTVTNQNDLLKALSGRAFEDSAGVNPPKVLFETTEQYLARGGVIKKVQIEPHRALTLEDLGL